MTQTTSKPSKPSKSSKPAKLAAGRPTAKKQLAPKRKTGASAQAGRVVTGAELTQLVRREAYRLATRRNFQNGSPFQDWLNAEAAVRLQLQAQGARLS